MVGAVDKLNGYATPEQNSTKSCKQKSPLMERAVRSDSSKETKQAPDTTRIISLRFIWAEKLVPEKINALMTGRLVCSLHSMHHPNRYIERMLLLIITHEQTHEYCGERTEPIDSL
jgi:hypothetical protein